MQNSELGHNSLSILNSKFSILNNRHSNDQTEGS